MYGSVHAVFQHGIMAPFRGPRRDPRPPQLDQQQQQQWQHVGVQALEPLEGGDAPQHAPRRQTHEGTLHSNQVRQRRPNRPNEERVRVTVESLHTAENFSEDEMDSRRREPEQSPSAAASENQQEKQEEPAGASANSAAAAAPAKKAQSKTKSTKSNSTHPETKPQKKKLSKNEPRRNGEASESQSAERQPSQTDVQVKSFENLQICSCRHKKVISKLGLVILSTIH